MKNLTSIIFTCFLFASSLCCAENIPEIMNKAKQGDAEAQFKIAALYASGKIGKKDQESQNIMLDWLEKSASQNYAKAQNILYKKYFQLEKFEKAAKWAKEAIKRKDKTAMSVMAYLNYFGCNGVPINMQKAFELSEQSMDQPLSQVIQGRFYLNGCENFEKDISQAKDCAEKAIKMKNPYGYVLMADIYLSGDKGDDENLRNAEKNLQEAIKMDCSEAMVKLADLYLDNYGTTEKTVKATNLYVQASKFLNPASFRQLALYVLEKNNSDVLLKYQTMEALKDAAKYGDPQAQVLLWECYTTNKYGFETDNALAKQYMTEAINSGDPEALYDFAMILKRINDSSDNKELQAYKASIDNQYTYESLLEKAVNNLHPIANYVYGLTLNDSGADGMPYIYRAANMGVPEAQFTIANTLLESDLEQSLHWALNASKNKEINSLALAGSFLMEGKGCEQDCQRGIELLEEAAMNGNKGAMERLVEEYYLAERVEQDFEKAYLYSRMIDDENYDQIVENCKEQFSEDKLQELEIKYAEMMALCAIKSAENKYNLQKRFAIKYLK